jgi:hypothetical protein
VIIGYVYGEEALGETYDPAIEMDEISLTSRVPPTRLEKFVREQVASRD